MAVSPAQPADREPPARTKLFRSGNSQAVRIPKDLAFAEGTEVELVREGETLVIRPVRRRLQGLGAAFRQIVEGGVPDRSLPDDQDRDW